MLNADGVKVGIDKAAGALPGFNPFQAGWSMFPA